MNLLEVLLGNELFNQLNLKDMFYFSSSTFSTLVMVVFLNILPLTNEKTTAKNLIFETVSFDVLRKDAPVGFITLEKLVYSNNRVVITAESEVNAKLILNFKAVGSDKCIYQDDMLVYSSQFRKINNKVKIDQSISYHDGKYLFKENEKQSILNIQAIELNIMPLFFSEPKNVVQVYSDKFKQMVNVDYLGENIYSVVLPNGEKSTYHYQNGRCMYIDVIGTFFKVKLVRSKS